MSLQAILKPVLSTLNSISDFVIDLEKRRCVIAVSQIFSQTIEREKVPKHFTLTCYNSCR